MARRQPLAILLSISVFCFFTVSFILRFRTETRGAQQLGYVHDAMAVSEGLLSGQASAPKLENATLK
jgi:hypothetical protein